MENKKYNKKIVITGYYGMSNYGDDLFGVLSFLYLSEHYKSVRVSSCNIKTDFDVEYFRIPFVTSRIGRVDKFGKCARVVQNIVSAMWCNKYVLAGGSNLSYNSSLLHRKIPFYIKKYIKNISYNGVGLSFGPFKNHKQELEYCNIVNSFDSFIVRDNQSLVESKSLNVRNAALAFDLAVLGCEYFGVVSRPSRSRVVLGISLCHGITHEEIEQIADFLNNNINVEPRIFVLNFHEKLGDWGLSIYLQSKLDSEAKIVSAEELSVENIWREIGSCDRFFSVRLHGAITAFCNDVPFVLYEYQQKCTDFINTISQPEHLRIGSDSCGMKNVLTSLINENNASEVINRNVFLEKLKDKLKNSFLLE
ncbi:polysaccharide pyruvyl transferase family protein [Aeromonas veronii]|uniref:polysaccharide pyruvyl transferase family protein n=1 Tax=Aeromonas veronii TaxID=654 RepID=UPI00188BF4ED|nr:polysaccharide pyruvyl transferase family protein [Aeromonas veronii]MBF3237318.1 polysaccharide pyruvyl transferase family protein [Aeromonas veronii]